MIKTNVGTAFCWAGTVFGFGDFVGLFEADLAGDFVDFAVGFTGVLADGLAIGRTGFEIGRMGLTGGLIGLVWGDLVGFGDFGGAVGVDAFTGATPVLAPWLWFKSSNLIELPSISVLHFAKQLSNKLTIETHVDDKPF